jgi:hypothetical protein
MIMIMINHYHYHDYYDYDYDFLHYRYVTEIFAVIDSPNISICVCFCTKIITHPIAIWPIGRLTTFCIIEWQIGTGIDNIYIRTWDVMIITTATASLTNKYTCEKQKQECLRNLERSFYWYVAWRMCDNVAVILSWVFSEFVWHMELVYTHERANSGMCVLLKAPRVHKTNRKRILELLDGEWCLIQCLKRERWRKRKVNYSKYKIKCDFLQSINITT